MTEAKNKTCQLHVVIEGRVQGVGFRYATCAQAEKLGLKGWVRNLPDSRVEALFEGDIADLETMLAWCQKGPALARVKNVEVSWNKAITQYSRFEVRGYW
jgi:acylphosphatase